MVFRRVRSDRSLRVFVLVIRERWSAYRSYTEPSLAPRLCCGENTIGTFHQNTPEDYTRAFSDRVCKSCPARNTGWHGTLPIQSPNQSARSWPKDQIPPALCRVVLQLLPRVK